MNISNAQLAAELQVKAKDSTSSTKAPGSASDNTPIRVVSSKAQIAAAEKDIAELLRKPENSSLLDDDGSGYGYSYAIKKDNLGAEYGASFNYSEPLTNGWLAANQARSRETSLKVLDILVKKHKIEDLEEAFKNQASLMGLDGKLGIQKLLQYYKHRHLNDSYQASDPNKSSIAKKDGMLAEINTDSLELTKQINQRERRNDNFFLKTSVIGSTTTAITAARRISNTTKALNLAGEAAKIGSFAKTTTVAFCGSNLLTRAFLPRFLIGATATACTAIGFAGAAPFVAGAAAIGLAALTVIDLTRTVANCFGKGEDTYITTGIKGAARGIACLANSAKTAFA